MTSLKVFIFFIFMGATFGSNEFGIKDESDFSSFVSNVNNGTNYLGITVYLYTDLSLSDYSSLNPIGTSSSYQFRGTFDGQGHVISDFTLSSSLEYVGLFGYSDGLTIKNVVMDSSCSVTNSYKIFSSPIIGGIIGECYASSSISNIENCVNMGNVTFSGTINSYSTYVGGIVGELRSLRYSGIVKNCANYGSIEHSGTSGYWGIMGGIVGDSSGKSSNYIYIQNCINYGSITHSGTSDYPSLGGIVALSYSTYFESCVSAGKISMSGASKSGKSYIGSVVGHVSDSYIYLNHCCYTNDVKINSLYYTNSPYFPSSMTGSFFSPVSISSSLINDFNSQATTYGWNKWLFNSNNVSVTFKVNNNIGFSVTSQVVLLPDLASGSLVFSGWYTDSLFKLPFSSSNVSNATTLYGLYGVVVPITLNANGGSNAPASWNVFFNNNYGDLPTPSRTGYTFVGWYTETPEGDLVTKSTVVALDYDHTLYAHWNPIQYTISFMSDGESACPNITQDYDTPITLPVLTKAGYTFVCWCNDTELQFEYTAKRIESRNVTLYARWEVNNYTVSFKEECKDSRPPVSVTYDNEYDIQEPSSELGFLWWEIVETGQKVNNESVVEVAHNHTLCAVWEINIVTFNATGGDDDLEPVNVTYGENYENLINATRTGYTFVGWFLNETSTEPVTDGTDVTTPYPHTLYARWRINSYIVTFNPDNGENVIEKILEYNSTVIYPKDPEKRGYTFSGWDNDTLKFMPAEDVIITAQWIPNNYTVMFDVNGADDDLANKEMPVTFNTPYGTLPTLNKTGHTFAGWTDSLFGGNDVNSSTVVAISNNHILYALWTVNQYIMTFVSEGMKPVNITLNYNDIIIYPNENPSKSFHKFRRWCTRGENKEEECNVTHVPDHNLTFTASFDVDSSLAAGTAVGAFAVILFIILIVVIVFLIRVTRTVKHEYKVVDVELEEDLNEKNGDIEGRIRQQVEATSISVDIKKKLENPLKKADKSKGVEKIFVDLEVDCENAGDIDIIDSYRTTNVSAAVANAINNEKNLIVAAEYLAILYTSVREQEEYEKFSELYFGMKDVDDFMNSMDEKTIFFGGIISGFTSKKVAIQSLMTKEEEETTNMPSGVLFRVQNGMGYRIGKVDEETDEVLFELCSSFKIESMKEINKNMYIVVNLSFVSPMTKDEMVNL